VAEPVTDEMDCGGQFAPGPDSAAGVYNLPLWIDAMVYALLQYLMADRERFAIYTARKAH
jgi:hypothetical protein